MKQQTHPGIVMVSPIVDTKGDPRNPEDDIITGFAVRLQADGYDGLSWKDLYTHQFQGVVHLWREARGYTQTVPRLLMGQDSVCGMWRRPVGVQR